MFRFKIDEIFVEKVYKIFVSFGICYGVGLCILDFFELFINFKFFKFLCEWGIGFLNGIFIFIILCCEFI